MGWGTSFGSDPLHALTLCLSYCYVTPSVTPFAQTHPTSTPTLLRQPHRIGASYHRSGPAHDCADKSAIADYSALPSHRSARHIKRLRMVPFLQWLLLSLVGRMRR